MSYGAKADGITDDRPALAAAIAAAKNSGGGIVSVPDRRVRIHGGWLDLPSNVTVTGTGAAAELQLTASNSTSFTMLFRILGDNVKIHNLRLTRSTNLYGVMIDLRKSNGFTLSAVTIDGRFDAFPATFHGMLIYGDAPEVISNVTISQSTMRRLKFGVLQPSQRTVTVKGFAVKDSTFEQNYSSDLEFNAPNSVMTDVSVEGSTFRDNRASTRAGGWAVGLANVQRVRLVKNTIKGYQMNAIHIEDRSAQVLVSGNVISHSSTMETTYDSFVLVISGSHDINITGNIFDATAQTNSFDCVYVGPGGAFAAPYNVVLTDNTFRLRTGVRPLGIYGASNVTSYLNN